MTRRAAWIIALLGTAIIAAWQWATVHANYQGNWTALFCTGTEWRHPPLVESEHIYLFPNSRGYDGAWYHYMAHDPFLRTDLKSYIDDARLRYRRILIPLLAYALALGRFGWIDPAYELVFLVCVGLGVYWSCRLAQRAGLAAAWGLLFLLLPATPIAADRLVIDIGLATLTAAFLYYIRPASWKLMVVLAAAALTRETGLLLVAAGCAYLAWRREFRMAAMCLLSTAPAAAWYAYVQSRAASGPFPVLPIPLAAIFKDLMNPWEYPTAVPFHAAVLAADYLALGGMLLAMGLAFTWLVRNPAEPACIAAALFAVLGVFLQRIDVWQHVYSFGRVFTPLLFCLAAIAAQRRNAWLLAPVGMMLPRLAMQLAPQMSGVARWII